MTYDATGARVLLYCRAPEGDGEPIEEAYHQISADLHGTAGLLRNELLRDVLEPDAFVVLSEWESLDAFHAWESGPDHRDTTAPLRGYQDRSRERPFGLYEVTAAYRG
jgi:heme-degrading monooxygenase HmoA